MPYYILSLNHTKKHEEAITLWRPVRRGYTYYQESAGLYTFDNPQLQPDDTKLFLSEEEAGELFTAKKKLHDGNWYTYIPNTAEVHDKLGLNQTSNGLKRVGNIKKFTFEMEYHGQEKT